MTLPQKFPEMFRTVFPSRAVALLMTIGFADLVLTAVLHARGVIVELNPLMKVFLDRSELLFAVVKGATLVCAWLALLFYAKVNRQFVRNAALIGSGVYLTIWTVWFTVGRP